MDKIMVNISYKIWQPFHYINNELLDIYVSGASIKIHKR